MTPKLPAAREVNPLAVASMEKRDDGMYLLILRDGSSAVALYYASRDVWLVPPDQSEFSGTDN